MIRASAAAAELDSVLPPASAYGPGVAAEPTQLPARRESSRCCRSRPRAHEAPARASALRRPAPPRCYKPDMANATLLFPSAGSRRKRHPLRTDTGTAPRNGVSQVSAHRRPDWLDGACVKSRVFGPRERACLRADTPCRHGNLRTLAADDSYDFVTGSSASTGMRRRARRR